MVTGAWANESDGDVQSPIGYFARVTNAAADMDEVAHAFKDVMDAYECEVDTLIGHWLVREMDTGNVIVTAYPDEVSLTVVFQQLQDDYAEWVESE